MSFDTEKQRAGRRPVRAAEIDLPACGLTYGVAPCTAAGAEKCFNTNQTCQDLLNFDSDGGGGRLDTIKTLTFTEDVRGVPAGVFPFVKAIRATPTKIDPKKGLGARETVRVSLLDLPHHDVGLDPYVTDRSYDPAATGTFFGKLLARNRQSYLGRPLRIMDGYIGDQFSWADFKTRSYFITRIDGPNRDGQVTVEAKDVLSFIDEVQLPPPTDDELVADVVAADASFEVKTAEGFAAPGVVRINDELIWFGATSPTSSGEVLSDLIRGYRGSEIGDHDAGDGVQVCFDYDGDNVIDVLHDLLNQAGVDDSIINLTEFDFEQDVWFTGSPVDNVLSEPKKATEIIAELAQHFLLYLWWDSFTEQIRLRSIAPVFGAATLPQIDDGMIVGDVKVDDDLKAQITRGFIGYARRNFTESGEAKFYSKFQSALDVAAEGPDRFNREKLKKIFSDWIENPQDAATLASRLVRRYARGERTIKFAIDQRFDGFWVGDKAQLTTSQIQDETGAPAVTEIQIIEADQDGSLVKITAVTDDFTGKYAKYAPDSVPDYSSQTDEQKADYVSYADDDELLGGADDAFLYI